VAILSDDAIQDLNRRHLDHDYATDCLSFVLEQRLHHLEGEIAVSAETAQREAARLGWPAADELLLYVVHAMLHLVGEDDTTPSGAAAMRRREREVLEAFGLVPPWDDDDGDEKSVTAQAAGQEGHHSDG
jgi:probable rRNA maturation factor